MRKSQYCYEVVVKCNSHESPGIKKGEKASVFLENTTETMRECGNMDGRGHSDEVSDGSEKISLKTDPSKALGVQSLTSQGCRGRTAIPAGLEGTTSS